MIAVRLRSKGLRSNKFRREAERAATKPAVLLASAALLLFQAPVLAAPCKPADEALAGVYQLSGVRETGSVIRLAPDGRFGYMLTVGAFDEIAAGCWRRSGTAIDLVPNKIQANDGNPTFKTLQLRVNAKGGLVRTYKGRPYGVYERIRKWKQAAPK